MTAATAVWWAGVSAARPELRELLSPADRARIQRYRQDFDRDLYLVAWSLTRLLLSGVLDCQPSAVPISRRCRLCGKDGHGKPHLDPPGPRFSLTHASGHVAIAVNTDCEVGIDIEAAARIPDASIDGLVRGPGERPAMTAELLRRWVRKEAVLKATGHGLAVPMTRFAVSDPAAAASLVSWPDQPDLPDRLALVDLQCPPAVVGSLAVIGPSALVAARHGDALLAAV